MTRIDIVGPDLVIVVEGRDVLFALTSELRISLAHIAGVERAGDEARRWLHGVRFPGTNVPGVLSAGTFSGHDGRVFWDVHDADKAIAIRLHDERYAKLVIEVADPDAAIASIEAALAPWPSLDIGGDATPS